MFHQSIGTTHAKDDTGFSSTPSQLHNKHENRGYENDAIMSNLLACFALLSVIGWL